MLWLDHPLWCKLWLQDTLSNNYQEVLKDSVCYSQVQKVHSTPEATQQGSLGRGGGERAWGFVFTGAEGEA